LKEAMMTEAMSEARNAENNELSNNVINALRIDGDRLWAALMALAEIGATKKAASNAWP
jgi:hypothetical protein